MGRASNSKNQKVCQNKMTEYFAEKSNLVDDMEQDVGATKKDTDKVQFEIRKREKDLSAASDRATALREQFKEFEKMSNDLNTKLKQRADKLKAMEQREQTKKCDFDKEKTSAEIYVNRSKEMLGLVVEKAANSTVLVFTNVDKRDAERKFLCEFTIDGKIYKVLRCFPELDGIDKMEAVLNDTNDFSGFVSALRTRFQAFALH